MKMDRARIQIGRLSRFGLLEMSRQRLRPSLGESSHLVCPRCNGIGSIRSIESLALSILRLLGEDARKERSARVIVQIPVDVATYLINEKRDALRALEDKSRVQIVIVPNPHMQTPEYSLRRVREDESQLPENAQISYQIPVAPSAPEFAERDKKPPAEQPAVAAVLPRTAAPATPVGSAPAEAPAAGGGFWGRVKRWFGTDGVAVAETEAAPPPARAPARSSSGERHSSRGRDRRPHRRDRHEGSHRERGRDGRHDSRRDEGRRDERRHEARPDGRPDGRPEGKPEARLEGRRGDEPRDEGRAEEAQRSDGRREREHHEHRRAERPDPSRDSAREHVAGQRGESNAAGEAGIEGQAERSRGERGERRSRRGGRRRRRMGGRSTGGAAEGAAENAGQRDSDDRGNFGGSEPAGTQLDSTDSYPRLGPRDAAEGGHPPQREASLESAANGGVESPAPAPNPERPGADVSPPREAAVNGDSNAPPPAPSTARPYMVWSSPQEPGGNDPGRDS
jgi:ribonuclease E